jgi:hypothetical protein
MSGRSPRRPRRTPRAPFCIKIPVPITFVENLCSQKYWNLNVKKFGIAAALKTPEFVDAAISLRKFGGELQLHTLTELEREGGMNISDRRSWLIQ